MKQDITGAGNGLPLGRVQAITWTNDDLLSTGPSKTKFSEILMKIRILSLRKCIWKWRMLNGDHLSRLQGAKWFHTFMSAVWSELLCALKPAINRLDFYDDDAHSPGDVTMSVTSQFQWRIYRRPTRPIGLLQFQSYMGLQPRFLQQEENSMCSLGHVSI